MRSKMKRISAFVLALGLIAAMLCGCKEEEKVKLPSEYVSTTDAISAQVVDFSAGSGVYEDEFMLTLTSSKDAVIFYTTDGSDPTESETRMIYSEPISVTDRAGDPNVISNMDPNLFDSAHCKLDFDTQQFVSELTVPEADKVDKCTVIKAAALDGDGAYTKVFTNTYFVGDIEDHVQGVTESSKAAGGTLAIISITMDSDDLFDYETGIYVKGKKFDDDLKYKIENGKYGDYKDARGIDANYKQRGREWEREAHIDFFESDGTTTELVLSQDCGIRVQGNYSRSDYQKGFRLYARRDYGDNNFNYAVFGDELKNDEGEVMDKFKTLILRNGGNCAFTTKYSDTYWGSLVTEMDVDTLTSRPAVVYLNGEYWGLYVLQEDFSDDYFEDTHGVNKDDVVLYKGDAETYSIGYKLDLGDLPEGVTNVDYYFSDLLNFFNTHKNLESEEDFAEFEKLVDVESAMDYYAIQLWINNKWDWPGKNWSMWKTTTIDESNPYADGRWRYCIYDVEFGGVSGKSDAYTNTIKDDNYKEYGMLDMSTSNPSVQVYTYLMTNVEWRTAFIDRLSSMGSTYFEYNTAMERLDEFKDIYTPLYDQFFERHNNGKWLGDANNSNYGGYASYKCIADFLEKRADNIQPMIDYVDWYFAEIYPNL